MKPEQAGGANVLLLGTAEWDAPIPTNQHYVARELSACANVTFVESLGLRRPTLRRDDMVRMASRVSKAFGGQPAGEHRARPRPERTTIISPLVVPLHRTPTQALNRSLLRRATGGWLRGPGPRVLWTFTPVTYGLETAADAVVYHCVDLLAKFPGIDAAAIGRGERRLAKQEPMAIATSRAIEEHLVAVGFPRVTLLPNVAEVSLFSRHSQPAAQRRPAALFAGNLSVHKVDVALLEAIARTLQGKGELLLAGPVGPGFELQRLQALGARYLGALSHAELAEVAGTCVVGLIPYAINDYTRGVSPLKCFEYVAAGMTVLSTALPAVEELAKSNPHVVVADAAHLPDRLLTLLSSTTETSIADRIASAADHGWAQRGRILREILSAELGGRFPA